MTLLPLIIMTVAIGTLASSKENVKEYSVKKLSRNLAMSGRGDDPAWVQAPVLTDFEYPWEDEKAPVTKFKALHDKEWVYCLFEVTDSAAYIFRDKDDKSEVASSSRAEIFFRADEKMNPYYGLEIDPLGRVLDYEATYHRKFNGKWSWPKGHLVIKTNQRKDGYSIEMAVSKTSLKQLGLMKNNTLQAGLYRGDCFPKGNGEFTFKWISWVKPDSKTPDFHIPSSFGLLRLED
jgi:hypothetical protein